MVTDCTGAAVRGGRGRSMWGQPPSAVRRAQFDLFVSSSGLPPERRKTVELRLTGQPKAAVPILDLRSLAGSAGQRSAMSAVSTQVSNG